MGEKNLTPTFNGLTPQRDVILGSSDRELSRQRKPKSLDSIRYMRSSGSQSLLESTQID